MTENEVPETHVLAIASHVTSGYVGNTMATFCMQTLGCQVSAIHTVNYSNHVGYRRVRGRKSTPEDVEELYKGLEDSDLANWDVMLSGYCPSAALVEQVGRIARDVRSKSAVKPGSFFWIMDPVMGDNGRIYVAEDTVPVYRHLLYDADLILPNQFEVELLSELKITDLNTMNQAITKLHETYRLPHILITSIRLPPTTASTPTSSTETVSNPAKLTIIGSTATSAYTPRLFRITVPALPIYFSGTGDMFAALLVARLRQTANEAGLLNTMSWQSPDEVEATDLPLAKAAEKVLASMHSVLQDTADHYNSVVKQMDEESKRELNEGKGAKAEADKDMQRHLRLTRAAEVRVVRNVSALRHPEHTEQFRAQPVFLDDGTQTPPSV
ncbi:Ribokinase-like protein [Polychaeton citri CBS 116435]|uniref:pyridoxal kinase n=1 Tax=Polychaeton citri CBS 116435 TaxID=1314669 RepID=A0A9P4US59_9PEZI|nr:Ribokinase-like protein [Polychaeton citri CBS 116435]